MQGGHVSRSSLYFLLGVFGAFSGLARTWIPHGRLLIPYDPPDSDRLGFTVSWKASTGSPWSVSKIHQLVLRSDDHFLSISVDSRQHSPIIAQHDTGTGDQDRWIPSWIGQENQIKETIASKDIDRLEFLDNAFGNSTISMPGRRTMDETPAVTSTPSHLPMLAFLRIPKTGSTSILTWVAAHNQHDDTRRIPHQNCIIGPMDRRSDFPETFHRHDYLKCPHRTYESTILNWAKGYLSETASHHKEGMNHTESSNNRMTQRLSYSLEFFTIVRDPFDRLVSHFHYVRRIYPKWSQLSTPEQNATIRANNLTGWMGLLHSQGSKVFHLPNQKGALTEANFSTAPTLLLPHPRRSPPQESSLTAAPAPASAPIEAGIFTVLQECFEASLWLLTERFPRFFSPEATRDFLNPTLENVSSSLPTARLHNTKSRFQQRDENELEEMRHTARGWFADDFEFYETAVDHFRNNLQASKVDAVVVDDCLQRLEQRRSSSSSPNAL